jgi:hypothetical protein
LKYSLEIDITLIDWFWGISLIFNLLWVGSSDN